MLSRRDLLSAAICAAAPGAAIADNAAPPAPDDGIIRVPIQVTHNVPWTTVWLNGKGPYRFTLDTGDAAGYTIDRQLADSLALPHAYGVRMAGVTGSARSEAYQVKDVVIGGVLKDGGRVFVPENHGGFTVGLLPAQLLRLLPCDLDFGDGELRLYQKGAPAREGWERLHLMTLQETPFQAPPAVFLVDVMLDEDRYRLGIDTGDSEGVTIFASTVARRGLWTRYPQWLNGRAFGVIEAAAERRVRLTRLKLGPFEIPNPVVSLIDPSAHDSHEGVDGLIGMETLRRFALSFDSFNNALWIKPNGALRQPFRYNRSGLGFGVKDGRRVVLSVAQGSPAAKAGLAPGDIIEKTGQDFAWRLEDVPGAVLEFEVERAGVRQPVKLVLAELI